MRLSTKLTIKRLDNDRLWRSISHGVKALVLTLITLYQKTISPDHGWFKHRHPGGACRYQPTCSEYTKQSVGEHGVICGLFLGLARILRCHPWAQAGFDPILKKESN